MIEALGYEFFRKALLAGLLASVACGVMGTYVVVKRMASISGGLSHAAFGGVGLGYLLGFPPLLGATGFALASSVLLSRVYRRIAGGLDTWISVLWAAGMAMGIFFVSLRPEYPPDLLSYLFGNILFVSDANLWLMGALDATILFAVWTFFTAFQAVTFDEEFARVVGLPVERLLQALLALIALAVVMLIQVVGVILVIALLTLPAAIARQWSDRLLRMMVVGTIVGAACTTIGLYLSYWLSASFGVPAPPGPLVVLLALAGYGISSAFRHLRRS